jgi:predicted metal-dependent phosphoesterase TrpH
MVFRIDPHEHTYFSADGLGSPEAMVAAARAAGLNGIAVTDHDVTFGCAALREAGLIRADGGAVDGFLVVPGCEVSTAEGHLLCWGVDVPWMRHAPALEVARVVRGMGGLVVPAHPYDRMRAGIREAILDGYDWDGVEVLNAATWSASRNAKAREYAVRRGLPGTAGSDAHHPAALGSAWTEVDAGEWSVASFLQAVRSGAVRPSGGTLPLGEIFRKTFFNWFRIFGRGYHLRRRAMREAGLP